MNISAVDEAGKPVDWWFIYKVPQLSPGGHGTDSATGYEYVYYDSKIDSKPDTDKGKKVDKSPFVINEGKGALNLTLNLVFQNLKNPPPRRGGYSTTMRNPRRQPAETTATSATLRA